MVTWFGKRYPVYLGGGLTSVVNSIETAREALLHPLWTKRGRKYDRAVEALFEASTDLAGMEQAFEAAARDAGLLREE